VAGQGPNERSLAKALKDAQIPARDVAGVQLARRYAQLLDAARGTDEELAVYDSLGPKYLAALTAVGLTAAGRGAKGGGAGGPAVASKLDELRERRSRRGAG
jgi:hypothetical protein